MKQNKKYQKGFSLLEILLSVAIMTGLISGISVIFNDWAHDTINRTVAGEMKKVQLAAEKYVELNFTDLIDINVPTLGDVGSVSMTDIVEGGFLPIGFKAKNSFQQQLKIIIRNIDDDAANGSVIEVLTVGEDMNARDSRMVDSRLFDAATAGGPILGIVSNLDTGDNCCQGNIQSIYGTWSVDLNDFLSVYSATPTDDGGYMAAYGRVSVSEVADNPYLYRIEIPNEPELNRMTTNLDMNGNSIMNGGVVVSDSMNIGGNANFQGQETSGLPSAYVLSVKDNLSVGNNLLVLADGTEKGDIVVYGDDTVAHDFVVSGELNVSLDGDGLDGGVFASSITTNSFSQMGAGSFDSIGLGSGNLGAGNIYTKEAVSKGNINTNILQTSGVINVNTVSAANAVVGKTTFTSVNANINGNIVSEGSIAVNGNASIGNTITGSSEVVIDSLSCGSGCP